MCVISISLWYSRLNKELAFFKFMVFLMRVLSL